MVMMMAESSSGTGTGGDGVAATMHGTSNKGVNEFFNFYSQLQHSCMYYSNLAMRQLMVGYQNPVGMGNRESGTLPPVTRKKGMEGKRRGALGGGMLQPAAEGSFQSDSSGGGGGGDFSSPLRKTSPVKVVISGCDDDDSTSSVAIELGSPLRQRKVNFATPLSTIKIKSPTPIHSMEELHYSGYNNSVDSAKTGFTSDSDEEGSDTDVICQYMWRIRNVQQAQLQVPSGTKKRKKRKKKKKSKNGNGQDNNDFQDNWPQNTEEEDDFYDEDDPNAIYEVPLNEEDYEFISDVRLCGAPVEKTKKAERVTTEGETGESGGNGRGGDAGSSGRSDEMKFLYGDSGSTRILKMEETIEQCFIQARKSVNNRKY